MHEFTLYKLLASLLLTVWMAVPAAALTLKCESEGPMMAGDRLNRFVMPLIAGDVAAIADVEQGGEQRLHVRLRSKYFKDDETYLYLVEFELQQRVIDARTQRGWWPATEKWVAWGEVPSEAELRKSIADLIAKKVNAWKPVQPPAQQ